MARTHLRDMLPREDTVVIASCEPSPAELELTATEFRRIGLPTPPNEPDFTRFVERYAPELDVVFIITPHVFHAAQTTACLEAGVDVLLEKPMVMDAAEAEALIATRDRTGRLLVVAFPGSLSPQVRAAARMIASFTSGPGATTLPMRLYSQVRLGVNPEINAVSTLLIGVVAVAVIGAWLLQQRRASRS